MTAVRRPAVSKVQLRRVFRCMPAQSLPKTQVAKMLGVLFPELHHQILCKAAILTKSDIRHRSSFKRLS